MKKIGLFFGSFNPIHVGHLIIASHIIEHSDLDKIWFVVSPQNPLKNKDTLLGEVHRMALVRQAIEKDDRFWASDIEFKLAKPSYTINTLTYLQEKHPDKKFFLIMGEDNLNTLHKWKNADQIIKQFELIVYPRLVENTEARENVFLAQAKINYCDAPIVKISSSHIRALIKTKKSAKYLLPSEVLNYIEEMNFYK